MNASILTSMQRSRKDLYPVAYFQAAEEESADEAEVVVVQWAKASQPLSCPWLKRPEATVGYDFDVTKMEQIFDLLLKEKQLELAAEHQIPSTHELKGRKYCKWQNTVNSHNTVDYKALRQQIQSAIEQGRLVFKCTQMKVDKMPFPQVNMAEVASPRQQSPSSRSSAPFQQIRSAIEQRHFVARGNAVSLVHLLFLRLTWC